MGEFSLSINHVFDNKPTVVQCDARTTAEDICINMCKQLCISPLTASLFALRVTDKKIFLAPCDTFKEKSVTLDFRLRFKVEDTSKLSKLDIHAYDYYFHQARNDVLHNKIPGLVYENVKRELLGLGITDMYRVMLEKEIPKETIESEYRKYVPKEVWKRHAYFTKKPIRDNLKMLEKSTEKSRHNALFVKAEYMRQLDIIAPDYLSETYKALVEQEGVICNVHLKVSHQGVFYAFEYKKDNWELICTIEDICFVSIREGDKTTEISRQNGIPFYFKFSAPSTMHSFVSIMDGYYRLTCKWTFNICKELYTPSLQKLFLMKCHGPVGGEFSYKKLQSKRGNRPGCFIIRESELKYNSYFIDVCTKDSSKPKTYKLERITGGDFIFHEDVTTYKTLPQLMKAYSDPNQSIYLQECIPPSEYDISQLLLCKNESLTKDSLTDSTALDAIIPTNPMCINSKNLQVFRGQKTKREGARKITEVSRSMWKVTKGKKIEVAMKSLKRDYLDQYLKEFTEVAGQWAFLSSSAIVRLYGIAFTNSISLVMEYFSLGSLDEYLRNNKKIVKVVDLMEASSNLASALWHLTENNIVHGKIRCRKVMVYLHDQNSFTVKLADPGVYTEYSAMEIHWIPIECYSNAALAKKSVEADVWAFATTLWEIFSRGKIIKPADHRQMIMAYTSGKRLPKPPDCPDEIYNLMKECWEKDLHKRKKPQAVMRDINQILYQVYNSRRKHSYATVFKKNHQAYSTNSLTSNSTDSTVLSYEEDLVNVSDDYSCSSSTSSQISQPSWGSQNMENADSYPYDWSTLLTTLNMTSIDSLDSTESVYELNENFNIVLQGLIGQGFYGEVYKATMETTTGQDDELKMVAVKKLKTNATDLTAKDFEQEINIMKNLKHPNIVQILGVLRVPEIFLVMEYVRHGSLQSYLKIHKENLFETQLLKFSLDIAMGMEYLGEMHIVHRDLAARNILVVDEKNVKISDFGLARAMGSSNYYILKTPSREVPIKWYAPESLRDGKFSFYSDVWSYGVTMCEMFSFGEEPELTNIDEEVEGQQQQVLLTAIEKGARFPCPATCPKSVYIRLIYPCWEADPHKRPSFSNLISVIKDLLGQF